MSETRIQALLQEVKARSSKRHPRFYKPFTSIESALLKKYYANQLDMPLDGAMGFIRALGTTIATGYNRVVIGDYGAYIEIRPEQMILENICQLIPGKPKRAVKYIWMKLKKSVYGKNVKIYFQKGFVSYADYLPGMYYVAPEDVKVLWVTNTPE